MSGVFLQGPASYYFSERADNGREDYENLRKQGLSDSEARGIMRDDGVIFVTKPPTHQGHVGQIAVVL